MNEVNARPDSASFWYSTLGILGCFLVFAALLVFAYVPGRTPKVEPGAGLTEDQRIEARITTSEERDARLKALRDAERPATTTYAWIDKEAGVVRLPIERAMELTVQELGK